MCVFRVYGNRGDKGDKGDKRLRTGSELFPIRRCSGALAGWPDVAVALNPRERARGRQGRVRTVAPGYCE